MALIMLGVVVLDCPDPQALADFYAEVLDWQVTGGDDDWVEVAGPGGRQLAFQRVADYLPPQWPGQDAPAAAPPRLRRAASDDRRGRAHECSRSGAKLASGRTTDLPGLARPGGHPFCLCTRSGRPVSASGVVRPTRPAAQVPSAVQLLDRRVATGRAAACSSRATSSAARSTRTAFCQVSLARSASDQPRSSSSAIRFG